MFKNNVIDLKASADEFRRRQLTPEGKDEDELDEDELDEDELDEDELDEDELDEDELDEDELDEDEPSISQDPQVLYLSKDVKIFSTHIEIDNHTYSMDYIASTKRVEKKPPLYECMLSMAFIVISVVALITYLFLGKLQLGLLAVGYLSMILIAFLVLSVVCQQLKSTFSLELYNFNGDLADRISTLSKSTVAEIEKAIKRAMVVK